MKPIPAQLRELITVAALRPEMRSEMLRLVEAWERKSEADLSAKDSHYLKMYESLLRKPSPTNP